MCAVGVPQELYPIHPHRMFTQGKAVATGQNISVALNTFQTRCALVSD